MDNIDKRLEEELNLAPAPEEQKTNALALVEEAKHDLVESNKLMATDKVKEDFEFVRHKMRDAIELGSDAMYELLELARSSQGFEHFTAFAALVKALNETNRNLIDMHKGVVEIESVVAPDANDKPQVDPNVIQGTREAVMDMIRHEMGFGRGLEAASKTIVLSADAPGLQN